MGGAWCLWGGSWALQGRGLWDEGRGLAPVGVEPGLCGGGACGGGAWGLLGQSLGSAGRDLGSVGSGLASLWRRDLGSVGTEFGVSGGGPLGLCIGVGPEFSMGAGPGLYARVWGLEGSWALWVLGLGSPWGRTFHGGALRGGRAWVPRGGGPVGLCIGVRLGFSTRAGPAAPPASGFRASAVAAGRGSSRLAGAAPASTWEPSGGDQDLRSFWLTGRVNGNIPSP